MGSLRRLNQQGITIFELSIVVLILLLVGISMWIIISHIRENSQNNYDKVRGIPSTNLME